MTAKVKCLSPESDVFYNGIWFYGPAAFEIWLLISHKLHMFQASITQDSQTIRLDKKCK